MAQYYNTCPSVITVPNVTDEGEAATEAISEFDKHCKTLLSNDAEGWASELRRYLGTMQQDVKKDTDIVKWWQVSSLACLKTFLFANSNCHKDHAHLYPTLAWIVLDVLPLQASSVPANNYSLVPNKLPLTTEQVWVQSYLKKLPLQSQHGDLGLAMLRLGMLADGRGWEF